MELKKVGEGEGWVGRYKPWMLPSSLRRQSANQFDKNILMRLASMILPGWNLEDGVIIIQTSPSVH